MNTNDRIAYQAQRARDLERLTGWGRVWALLKIWGRS